ncbi:MAG: hypothetical protein ACTSV1_09590 [Alphaproteobacteria bacterium]
MSGTVEIYLCRAGQSLKQGRVEYSDSISTREDAKADAEGRCSFNKRLAKIAYYAVDDEGGFRVIYTHNNPNAIGLGGDAEPTKKKKKKPKKPVKKSLVKRFLKVVSGAGKKTKRSNKHKK